MSGENRRPTNGSQTDPNPNEIGKTSATKRLQKELMDLVMNSDKSITAFPEGDNLFRSQFFHLILNFILIIVLSIKLLDNTFPNLTFNHMISSMDQ
jgi:hypothetical protein